jgi:hypothetical protein
MHFVHKSFYQEYSEPPDFAARYIAGDVRIVDGKRIEGNA